MQSLFAYEEQLERIKAHRPPLQRLDAVIDWEWFREPIEAAFRIEPKGPGGRPPYDRVMMFKILILQRYYNLSNEQTEFQILDRLSFLEFLGLELGDKVPDANTIRIFKETLTAQGVEAILFEQFTRELEQQGVIAKEGSLVDASFVEVPRQHHRSEEKEALKQGAVPLHFGEMDKNGKRSRLAQKDLDARWARKNQKMYFGYKNHIKADTKSKLIQRYAVTDAAVHDSQMLEVLVNEEDKDQEVHADKAYHSEKIEAYLAALGCLSRIHERGTRNHPLSDEQKAANRHRSKIRARVEHIFGFIHTSMKGSSNRCIGYARNRFQIGLMNLTYNLFRYEQLVRLQGAPRL
jgi:IS5 family transposase